MTLVFIGTFILQILLARHRPHLAVAVVLALLPSYLLRTSIFGIPTTILEALVLGAIIGWTTRRPRLDWLRGNPLVAPTVLFLIAGTIAIFVSPDRIAALGIWKAYIIEPILFGILIADVMREQSARKFAVMGLACSAFFVTAIALLQHFAGFPIPPPWQAELRVTGPFEFPNAVGLFLAPIAVLFLTNTRLRLSLPWRLSLGVAGALSILAIVFSKTEAGLIGIAAGLAFFVFQRPGLRSLRRPGLCILILLFAFLLSPLGAQLREKLLLQDFSGTVRRIMWSETVDMLRDRPLLGAGLSGYPIVFAPYHNDPAIEIFQYPHTIVLNFWSEMGLLGLIAFGWIIFEFFRMTLSNPSLSPLILRGERLPLAAAMTTLLVHGLADVPYFKNDLSILFWTMIGFMVAATLPKTHQA